MLRAISVAIGHIYALYTGDATFVYQQRGQSWCSFKVKKIRERVIFNSL